MIKDSIQYTWKSFKVDLPALDLWLTSNAPASYDGMSADPNGLIIWFTEVIDLNDKLGIEQYWNSLTQAGESAKIEERERLDRAVAYAIENLPYKPLAQWAPAEMKIFMRQPLTYQDRLDLSALYPNV